MMIQTIQTEGNNLDLDPYQILYARTELKLVEIIDYHVEI